MIAIKAAYVAILALAAFSDVRRFLIPNAYPLCLIILAGVAWFAGFPFSGPLWTYFLHFAVALGCGMLLFHFGWFGGGDAKLYAAVALWFSFSQGVFLLFAIAMSGLAVIGAMVILRPLRRALGSGEREKVGFLKRKIAYGLAIAVGGIFSLFWLYP